MIMNEDIKNKITDIISKNEVCLFMKGTPEVPQCGFSLAVSNVLKHLKVNFYGINVLEDPQIREGIKAFSDWPTIPQLYVKGEFIGGCDIVKEMFEKGDLQNKFKEKKVSFSASNII
jgi:monothiol glutaredoxin